MKKFCLSLLLAAVGFAWVFACPVGNFWLKITVVVCVLTALAGVRLRREEWNVREIGLGIVSALALYAIFWGGDWLSAKVFDFAPRQVESIYEIKSVANRWLIGCVLFFITSPGEEIFWRGYLQRFTMERWGRGLGTAAAIAAYALVHVASGNFMLVGAAAVAGAFWSLLHAWRKNLTACIVSHSLWTVLVFLLFPIR